MKTLKMHALAAVSGGAGHATMLDTAFAQTATEFHAGRNMNPPTTMPAPLVLFPDGTCNDCTATVPVAVDRLLNRDVPHFDVALRPHLEPISSWEDQ